MSAAARYAATQTAAEAPRDLELRAFRYVNGLLAGGAQQGGAARVAALHKTHRLWAILLADLLSPGNALPADLKARIASLGLWAQRESMARMSDGAGVEPLMALHRDMIEALEAQRRAPGAPAPPPAAAFSPATA